MQSYSDKFAFQVTVSPSEVSYSYSIKAALHLGSETPLVDAKCGPSGLCNQSAAATSPSFCSCVHQGFSAAVSPPDWNMDDTSRGCRRNVPLDCGGSRSSSTDWFAALPGVKLPDTLNSSLDMGITLDQCRARCLANCSCVAYAAADIQGSGDGSGCLMWPENLIDLQYLGGWQTLYIRLAKSESGKRKERSLLEWRKRLQIILGIAEGVKHLHEGEGSAGNVIHRDLKPANVLLDGG
ncbi:receptor-like serine/threonine-protein kinase SD1-8 [Setaria viridis]|uniref:receptor-like serine/threonine-protein kinase SD1-8 n=1 Tax=Setaria viridis TaxID=4556 RepID=UPI003B3B14BF